MNDTLPQDLGALDDWLAVREGAVGDVLDHARAGIDWAGTPGTRTPVSIVYLHGYSATRHEVSPLMESVAAALGANVFFARLTGHGRSAPEAMGEALPGDWQRDAALAYRIGEAIGERVVLVGCSTGGTLATIIAADVPDTLAAMVLLSPNYGPRDPRSGLLGWPGARTWVPWVVGRERVVEAENEAHARYWTLRYPTVSQVTMMAEVKVSLRSPIGRIGCPVFVSFCEDDQVVDARRIHEVLARMQAADVEVVQVEPKAGESNHVIVGDAFGAHNTEAVCARLQAFLTDRAGLQSIASASAK